MFRNEMGEWFYRFPIFFCGFERSCSSVGDDRLTASRRRLRPTVAFGLPLNEDRPILQQKKPEQNTPALNRCCLLNLD